jgi:dihydroorotate dehydrogenase (fumarate)
MTNLGINYLGLNLKSPVIVSSSRLTSNITNLKLAEASGAGAVVLKSLFEEQITNNVDKLASGSGYPEADDYLAGYLKSHTVDDYVELVRTAKKNLTIPVIPSINCYSSEGWTEFASKLADSGADALEINVFFMPVDRKKSAAEAEKLYLDLIEKLMKVVKIPVALKIGPRFSNILYIIDQFYMRGVRGVVMFNRFYEPDIDVDNLEIIPAPVFSNPDDRRLVIRWIAMASAQDYRIDISASTGVNDGKDAVRYLLAGATSVQVCSVLYRKGLEHITAINKEIAGWMAVHEFKNISDFRGKLNWSKYRNPAIFERSQFMKHFSSED